MIKNETVNTGEKQKEWLFKKGQSGNPKGRPKGAKNKLSTEFVEALSADFERYGLFSIARVRRKDPGAYLKIIASVLPKDFQGDLKHEIQSEEFSAKDAIREFLAAKATN